MDYTGYLLRTAFLRAATLAAREFGDQAHPRDAAVIATLDAYGPLSQQQLGNGLNVNRTAMVKLIDGLEARGYVERAAQPGRPSRLRVARHTGGGCVHERDAAPDGPCRGRTDGEPLIRRARTAQRAAATADRAASAHARRSHRVPARPRAPRLPRGIRRGAGAAGPADPSVRRADADRGRDGLPARARRSPAGLDPGRGRAGRRPGGQGPGRAPARPRGSPFERVARHGGRP